VLGESVGQLGVALFMGISGVLGSLSGRAAAVAFVGETNVIRYHDESTGCGRPAWMKKRANGWERCSRYGANSCSVLAGVSKNSSWPTRSKTGKIMEGTGKAAHLRLAPGSRMILACFRAGNKFQEDDSQPSKKRGA